MKIYALDAKELAAVSQHLEALDKLTTDVKIGAVADLPDRIVLRDSEHLILGYAVFEEGFWAFEATTVEEREEKGQD